MEFPGREIAALAVLAVAGCGGGGGGGSSGPPVTNNRAPTFSSPTFSVDFLENGAGTVGNFSASDADGDALTYMIAGADSALFAIDGSGNLRFMSAPDHEVPRDNDENNDYVLSVTANDGKTTASAGVSVRVTNDREGIRVTRIATGLGDLVALSGKGAGTGTTLTGVRRDGTVMRIEGVSGAAVVTGRAFPSGQGRETVAAIEKTSGSGGQRVLFTFWRDSSNTVGFSTTYEGEVKTTYRPITGSIVAPALVSVWETEAGGMQFALGDPLGVFAQDVTFSGFGKIWKMNFSLCGSTVDDNCTNPQMIAAGIQAPVGGGWFPGRQFFVDRGSTVEHEVTFYNPDGADLNFGWPYFEGIVAKKTPVPAGLSLLVPQMTVTKGLGPRQMEAIVGGWVYRGAIAQLQNRYVFGDTAGKIYSIATSRMIDGSSLQGANLENRTVDFQPDVGTLNSPVDFAEDSQGTLYVLDNDGEIFRVSAA